MEVQTESKPGYLTTEFWLSIVVLILTNLNVLDLPDRWRGLITLAALVGYSISRGLAKQNVPRVVALHEPGHPSFTADPTDTLGGDDHPAV